MTPGRKLFVMVGLPRAGKTTACLDRETAAIVSPDAIRLALHGQRFQAEAEPFVWAIARTMVRALFLAGHCEVVVDATNVTQKRRDEWVREAAALEAMYVPVIVETSPAECIRRARAEGDEEIIPVIERMAKEWDLPKPAGWEVLS